MDETTNGFENRERLLAVRRALLSGNKEQVNELWKQVGAESGAEAQTALLAVDHGVYAAAWVALCALGDGVSDKVIQARLYCRQGYTTNAMNILRVSVGACEGRVRRSRRTRSRCRSACCGSIAASNAKWSRTI